MRTNAVLQNPPIWWAVVTKQPIGEKKSKAVQNFGWSLDFLLSYETMLSVAFNWNSQLFKKVWMTISILFHDGIVWHHKKYFLAAGALFLANLSAAGRGVNNSEVIKISATSCPCLLFRLNSQWSRWPQNFGWHTGNNFSVFPSCPYYTDTQVPRCCVFTRHSSSWASVTPMSTSVTDPSKRRKRHKTESWSWELTSEHLLVAQLVAD